MILSRILPNVGGAGGGAALIITGVTNFTSVFRLFKVDVGVSSVLVGVINFTTLAISNWGAGGGGAGAGGGGAAGGGGGGVATGAGAAARGTLQRL